MSRPATRTPAALLLAASLATGLSAIARAEPFMAPMPNAGSPKQPARDVPPSQPAEPAASTEPASPTEPAAPTEPSTSSPETPAPEPAAPEKPAAETPAAETPAAESPAAESPAAETPGADATGEAAAAAGASEFDTSAPEDGGPIIVGEKVGKYNWWDLQWVRAELEFFGEFKEDKQKDDGQPELVVRENRIRVTNNISFESYIGHKNLIDLTGVFKLGFEDQTVTSNQSDPDLRETPLTDYYNVQALVLGASKTPFTLYSFRDETSTSRDFASTLRTVTTEHGAIFSLDDEMFPTRLQYFHRDQEQSDPGGSLGYNSTQDTFNLQSQARLTENHRIDLNHIFDHISENPDQGLSDEYDRNDFTLTDFLYFGPETKHHLRSTLRFYDQGGRFDQRQLRWDEYLQLQHSNTLESRYNFSAEDQTNSGQDQRTISGDASVTHKLFDSLVSTATAGGNSFEIPGDFTSTEGFTSGTFDYTKRVPHGRVNASVGLSYNHQDNSDRGSDIIVLNESRTFVDPFPIILSRRNIIPSSIIITDLTGFITFTENVDYSLLATSAQVEITRLALGSILDGQTVLISYRVGPEPGSVIDTTTQIYSVRYSINEGALNGLSLYAVNQITDHSLLEGDESLFTLDDVNDLRFGAEYRIGEFFFVAEQQFHDSTISPYDRLRLEAHYDRRVSRDSTLSLELVHESLDYSEPSNKVELDRALVRWRHRLRAGLDLTLYAQYRDDRDELNGDTRGFEQSVELRWNIRQTRIFAGFHNAFLEGDSSDRTSQTFTIGVNRSF